MPKMNVTRKLRVFILEDDLSSREKIEKDLKDRNYRINFFSKNESIFDLIKFNPDILIQDYFTQKVVNLHEWEVPI